MWVRFDDEFPEHRKVAGLSDPAFRLHVSAIFWCARNLTDGAVPAGDLEIVAPRTMKRPDKFVAELVDRKLWHETKPLGWVINDYLKYQPSRKVVLALRDKKSGGALHGNHIRWHVNRGIVDDDCEYCNEP